MIWGDSLIATDKFSVVAKEFFVFTAIKDSGSTSKEATTGHNSPLYIHFFFALQNNNRGGYNVGDKTNKPASKAADQFNMVQNMI